MSFRKVYLQPIIIIFVYLFFVNNQEIFLIDQLEKGVKKYVEDKSRKDEILAVTSLTKSSVKQFNKLREEQVKEFRLMNGNPNISRATFKRYFQARAKERLEIQILMIENRVMMHEKITNTEWDLIMEMENHVRQKNRNKIEKKLSRGKYITPFASMENVIDKVIDDESKKIELMNMLESFKSTHHSWVTKANDFSALHNEIIAKKDATEEELTNEIMKLNILRMDMYINIIDFRFSILEHTDNEEWEAIINELNSTMKKQKIMQ